jgi:nitroimidazol reductase NimA-like FMN-containing flavoprotein (pyridoxamine 5'-phosphate oxidase superfamily)
MKTPPTRKPKRQFTDLAEMEEVLTRARVMRLGLTDGQWPYVVPVNFAYEPGSVWFHSSPAGFKMDLLAANPKVCFEVEDDWSLVTGDKACDWSVRFRSIIGFGEAAVAQDPAQKAHGLDRIMRSHGFAGELAYPPEVLAKTAVVRIAITSMTGKKHHWT